jgi:hypothetical protein
MSTAVATSNKSAVKVTQFKGASESRTSGSKEIYVSTRTTRKEDGTFKVEMIEYPTDGSGDAIVIGERDPGNPNKWNWNGNGTASTKELSKSESNLSNASKNQINSSQMQNELVRDSQDQEELNRANAQPNKATTPPETGDTSKPSSEPPKNGARTRDKFGDMNYPIDRDQLQDVIKFDMLKYETKKVEGLGFGGRSEPSGRTIGTVALPIPGGISDANACNWGDDNMNPLQLAATAATLQQMGTNMPGVGDAFGGIIDGIKKNNDAVNMAIDATVASQVVGTNINSVLGRFGGSIINPNLELLFQSPSLRPFTFQFKMSPRSKDEAEEILKIIRFFKQGMAPIREQSRLFLKTPHTFKIKYVQLGQESKFLNKFKECALLSCSIQYTPEGNYAPYEDGAMSSYQMSLQFKELEPIFNDDYGSDGDLPAEIGF